MTYAVGILAEAASIAFDGNDDATKDTGVGVSDPKCGYFYVSVSGGPARVAAGGVSGGRLKARHLALLPENPPLLLYCDRGITVAAMTSSPGQLHMVPAQMLRL